MLTAFFLLFQLGISSHAELPAKPKSGRYTLGAEATYFKTDANYESGGGSYESIPGNVTATQFDLRGAYEFGRNWRTGAGLGISSVVAEGDPNSGSNSGLSDLSLSAQYWLNHSGLHIVPQADFVYPLFKIDEASQDTLIGEGAMTFAGGSWLIWPQAFGTPFAYLAFKYRDGGRSFLLPYSLGMHFSPRGHSWWVQGELRGYRTIVDDADTDNRTERETFLATTNSGSDLYYSINPSLMEVKASGGLTLLRRWIVHGGIAQSINGASAAQGMTFSLGLTFGSRPGGRASINVPDSQQDQFQVPEPEYDEDLFNESSVIVPDAKVSPKRKAPPKKKPKKPVSIDKMIQDTEKSLERRK